KKTACGFGQELDLRRVLFRSLRLQGKFSFLASSRGHETARVGTVMMLKPRHDWFFPYYREKAIAYALGMPVKDIFLHMLSREGRSEERRVGKECRCRCQEDAQ